MPSLTARIAGQILHGAAAYAGERVAVLPRPVSPALEAHIAARAYTRHVLDMLDPDMLPGCENVRQCLLDLLDDTADGIPEVSA